MSERTERSLQCAQNILGTLLMLFAVTEVKFVDVFDVCGTCRKVSSLFLIQ